MRGGDRGSATVWSLGLMALLVAVFTALMLMSQAVIARHRAGGAADLAALAAADHALDGERTACALAARVAAAQGALLRNCAVTGEISDVVAEVGGARVRSRAGPASAVGDPAVPPASAVPAAQVARAVPVVSRARGASARGPGRVGGLRRRAPGRGRGPVPGHVRRVGAARARNRTPGCTRDVPAARTRTRTRTRTRARGDGAARARSRDRGPGAGPGWARSHGFGSGAGRALRRLHGIARAGGQ